VLGGQHVLAAFLGIHDATTAAAVVAVIVAFVTALATAPVRFVAEKRLHRAQAATDYEYAQRKELRAKIGTYQGRLLEAAANLNYRINEIYRSRSKGWLNVSGDYTKRWPRGYFFNSTVLRLITFVALAESFEREAIYIDSRIANPTDRLFLFYVKALRWALTDTALFDGLGYSEDAPTDHFYSDHLRRMCWSVWTGDKWTLVDLRALEDLVAGEHELAALLEFIDGLDPDDRERFRWDRIVAFQLVLMAFIETFGYEVHKTEQNWFNGIAARMRPEVATNLLDWMPKLGIGEGRRLRRDLDPGGRRVKRALERLALPDHMNRLRTQAGAPSDSDPQA
jgi:hypothetical protein